MKRGGRRLVTTALRASIVAAVVISASGPQTASNAQGTYDVEEKSIDTLQRDLTAGRVTSERLVEQYLERIRELDQGPPALHSVLAINPRAADEARRLDAERAQGRTRGRLHGIPVLLKDNIESADPLPTTAGSLALEKNVTGRDAPLVARLRDAGVIVLGKTNLSEWANIRSAHSTSGWSAVGGFTRNPYAFDRNPSGSSSGSGVAVAVSLASAAVGTETDGSVTSPASVNGVVGLKPTVGLVSRRYIIPITGAQDTAGPMARTVADAAALLTVMAGRDEGDAATLEAEAHKTDYVSALVPDALSGKRLGIMRFSMGYLPELDAVFGNAVAELEAAGATVVTIDTFDGLDRISRNELTVLLTDLRDGLNAYLGATPPAVATRTLADLIAFNSANASREMPFFGQDLFERSEQTAKHDASAHATLRDSNRKAAGPDGIDRLLKTFQVDALIAPTTGPAWTTDLVGGDHPLGGATTLAAVAGYPHLTVPMGAVQGAARRAVLGWTGMVRSQRCCRWGTHSNNAPTCAGPLT